MNEVEVWTDGSCSAIDRVGGWGAVMMTPGSPFIGEISGYVFDTTSQRMELTAPIKTMEHFTEPTKINLYSDSAYLINCIHQKWIVGWRKNGWRSSKGDPVKNQDLWITIHELLEKHEVTFIKVKGHVGIEHNERADVIAGEARQLGLASIA